MVDDKMDVDFDFNKSFYSLQGSTLKDRKKNFFILLHKTSRCATPQHIELSLRDLQPRHYQEELFKIDALIYFHQVNNLLEILKGGNEIFVSKIIKHQWFFEDAFKTINAETLVNDFLPTLSFSLRMKVLKRLSVSLKEEQMDSIFDCLLERYGLFIATKFLSSCSVGKIEHVLQTNEIKLFPNQLRMLYQKDAKLLVLYLLQHKDAIYDNDKLFSYIAQKDPELFCELRKKFKIVVSLGKRTTKRLIDSKKENVVADINEYLRVLKKAVTVRRLRGYFPIIFEGAFSKDLDSYTFRGNVTEYLKLYPKKRRWDMLSQTITKLYNKDISENITLLPERFITFFNETNTLRKWAKVKFTETDDNKFLKYLDTKESIPLLKQKINLTSQISERSTLLELMVLTCAQNKDMTSLEEVMKYFCFRHRNDDYNVRSNFLHTVEYNLNLQELNENHWKYINEQIELIRIKNEFSYYRLKILIKNHLIFLYKNNKPTSDSIKKYITDIRDSKDLQFTITIDDNKNMERVILMDIIKIFPEITRNDEGRLELVLTLMTEINDFNTKNANNHIYLTDYPIFEEVARSIFQKSKKLHQVEGSIILQVLFYNWNCLDSSKKMSIYSDQQLLQIISSIYDNCIQFEFNKTLRLIVCKTNRVKIENDILDIYFKKLINYSNVNIPKYFMINDPAVIVKYYDQILKNLTNLDIIEFDTIKKHSHLNLDQKALQYFKSRLPTTERDFAKVCIKAFSILMTTDDFILHVQESYQPKSEKLDITNEAEDLYQLQCHAVKMLKNIQEPYKALEVLLKFAVGDYLQESLSTLYKIFYLSPEYLLMPFLEILSKRAVSVRKHSLFLACELLDQTKALHMFRIMSETEKNISSQKHLLSAALKYFQKNPSDEVFNLFIDNINFIDKNDKEFLETLTDISKIPNMYKHMYVEKIWKFYENLEKENVNISNYLQSLLRVLNKDVVSKLNLEFCRKTILKYFLKNTLSSIDDFIYNFITEHDQQKENFDFVFNILTEFKNENLSDINKATNMMIARNFCTSFFYNLRNDKNKDLSLKFKQYWELTFTMKDDFASIVLLNLLKFYYDSNQEFSNTFSCAVGDYFEELLTQFGTHVTYLFVDPFKDFFNGKHLDMYNVLLNMLNKRQHIELRIVSYKILTSRRDTEHNDVINQIEDHLRQNESDIVQILYKEYIIHFKSN